MQWDQPWRAELCLSDSENALIEIDIGAEQVERFGMAQSGHRYQSEQTLICRASRGAGRRQRKCCRQSA